VVEVFYEGYAPGGVAMVVHTMTDNRNRTAPEIKKIFEKAGGAIGAPGCVAWQFKDCSVFLVDSGDEEKVLEAILAGNADAQDIVVNDGKIEITAAPNQFDAISRALAKAKLTVLNSDITKIAENRVAVTDAATAQAIQGLLDALDEYPDVQEVFSNGDLPATADADAG